MELLKKIRKNKHTLKFILMFVCVYFLVSHVWKFSTLLEYEDVPSYIDVYKPQSEINKELIDSISNNNLDLLFTNNFNTVAKYEINDSNYDAISNTYTLQHKKDSQRDIVLVNIMFDLFLISLLWHSKVKDEEED